MLIYSIPSFSQIFGEYSLPHTTSIDVLKQYIGQKVKVPSNHAETTSDVMTFERFGGVKDELYIIKDITINSKYIKLVLNNINNGKKVTAKVNILDSPKDYKNMSSCESFFLYDKLEKYINECKTLINNYYLYNISGDKVAVITDFKIGDKMIFPKEPNGSYTYIPNAYYTFSNLVNKDKQETFISDLENAKNYCKHLGTYIKNIKGDSIALVTGCCTRLGWLVNETDTYIIKNLDNGSIFTSTIEKAQDLYSLTNEEHISPSVNISHKYLEFKNTPINGTLTEMVKKMQNLGYKLEESEGYVAIMEGEFANESCEIVLYASSKTKTMHSIIVNFGEQNSWYSLKSKYKKLKEQLTNKYKISPKSTEYFADPYYEGDGYEMQALKKEKCFYFSTFNFNNGKIGLYIIGNKVQLLYQDSKGKSINEKEENANAYDDL